MKIACIMTLRELLHLPYVWLFVAFTILFDNIYLKFCTGLFMNGLEKIYNCD